MRFFSILLLILLMCVKGNAQVSVQQFPLISESKLSTGIVDNSNLFLNYNLNIPLTLGIKSTVRFERLGSNFLEVYCNYNWFNTVNITLNNYVSLSNQFFVYNNWTARLNTEFLIKVKKFTLGFEGGYQNITNAFTYNFMVAYTLKEHYTIYSSIGQQVEYSYLYQSADFGLNILKNDVSVRALIKRFKENGNYFKRNTRLTISFALNIT